MKEPDTSEGVMVGGRYIGQERAMGYVEGQECADQGIGEQLEV